MSFKLKALGLSLIAALAVSAVGVISASAETGGHFTTEVEHVIISGDDVAANPPKFHAFGNTVECKESTYAGTISSATNTATEVTITPTYKKCNDTAVGATADVDMHSCDYLFTIRKTEPEKKDNTTHLICPAGGGGPTILVTGPFGNCKLEVTPNQTPAGGVVYKTGGSGKTHDITLEATASALHTVITEGGGNFFKCGTTETTTTTAELLGEVTVTGKNTAGESVGITATGF